MLVVSGRVGRDAAVIGGVDGEGGRESRSCFLVFVGLGFYRRPG